MNYLENADIAKVVFEHSSDAMLITNDKNIIVAVNPAFTKVTMYKPEEVIGKTPKIFASGFTKPLVYKEMWNDIITKGQWQGELKNKKKDGSYYNEWINIQSIAVEGSVYYLAIFRDVTEEHKNEHIIKQLAYHDTLTGLPNRALFTDRLNLAIHNANRFKKRIALMYLDLDGFKTVNDRYGHDIGDLLLQQVSERITNVLRKDDTLSRMGGDEFTVILPNIHNDHFGVNDVSRIAQKIIDTFAEPFIINEHSITSSTSIGIALYSDNSETALTLLKYADIAMYRAKNDGKNSYKFY